MEKNMDNEMENHVGGSREICELLSELASLRDPSQWT